MIKKFIFLLIAGVLFNGCGLLPYKTEFTCPNAIGGSCGNALGSYNSALNDVKAKDKTDNDEYVHTADTNEKTECISCKKGNR